MTREAGTAILGAMKAVEPFLDSKSHVIWDWNGTLINDVDLHVEIMAEVMGQHGLPVMTREDYRRVFRMPIRDYYRDLGFDLESHAFEKLAYEFIRRYRERVLTCALFEGTRELLEKLRAAEKHCAVLSAAQESELKELLTHFGIAHYFEIICGLSDCYAHSKMERGRDLMKHWQVEPKQVLLIGDMDHDLEVGRELGVDVLLLGDGHQAYERLIALHPHSLACRYGKSPKSPG